ncbi:MAG: ABC transporter substrate-binding protein [Desulfovibrio sp.]
MRTVLYYILIFLLCCSGNAFASEEPKLDKVILQLRWDHGFQFAGFYAAKWEGYYKEAGLDVEIRSAIREDGSVRSATKEVAYGNVDFGIGGGDILFQIDRGLPLTIVAPIFQKSPVVIHSLNGKKLNSPNDLRGQVLSQVPGDLTDVETRALISKLNMAHDVRFAPYVIEKDFEATPRYTAMPGYIIAPPSLLKNEKLFLNYLRPSDHGVDFLGDTIFTSQDMVANNPDVIKRFVKASIRGWQYTLSHPQLIAQKIINDLPRKAAAFDFETITLFQVSQVNDLTLYPLIPLGTLNVDRWRQMHIDMKRAGIVHGLFDESKTFYDPFQADSQDLASLLKVLVGILIAALILVGIALIWVKLLRKTINARTTELTQTNLKLREEVEQHRRTAKELQKTDFMFKQCIENIDDVFWISSIENMLKDEPSTYHSPSFFRLFGFPPAGKGVKPSLLISLVHPDDIANLSKAIEKLVNEQVPLNEEFRIVVHGDEKWIQTRIFPVIDNNGETLLVGLDSDVTQHRLVIEENMRSLREKDILLKEIHHRVKNNMQIIISLLNLQSRTVHDERDLAVFNESRMRIQTMSLIHEELYQSKDLSYIDCGQYLERLCRQLFAVNDSHGHIAMSVEVDDVKLTIDQAIPCGLIVNEMVTNSIKHAFPDKQQGHVTISMSEEASMHGTDVSLVVKDNGVGMTLSPEEFINQKGSLGGQLILNLSKQLGGNLHMGQDHGTVLSVTFPRKDLEDIKKD